MELELRFAAQEIGSAVERVAREISVDYGGRRPLLIGVLKGSFVFLADVIRALSIPCEVDFVRARSYGSERKSSGAVQITQGIEADLRDRDVIVVEDIADTGLTMNVVVDRIRACQPASVKRCALLVREGCEPPDYMGFRVGPGFVVGYGIDYAEQHRGLSDIRAIRDG